MYVSVTLSPTVPTPVAPAADVESSSLERCTTAPPSGVVMKTQPLVSSAPPVRRTPAAVAAASPAPPAPLVSTSRGDLLRSYRLTSNGETHHTFLRPQHLSHTTRLYHSVWSRDRALLLKCSWVDDAAVIDHYRSLCREKSDEFSENQSALFAIIDDRLCDAVSTSSSSVARSVGAKTGSSHLRVKRGFIVPGTLWCGSGNKALSYADLGAFQNTDSCCREHDQCQDTILSFESKFGFFNRNIFTMSHCDCDNKFQGCLRNANDRISDVVGYTFFNLLKMNCFQLSYHVTCTERNWFGMCKATKTVLQADVRSPTAYAPAAAPSACDTNATQVTPPPSVTPHARAPPVTSDPTSAYLTTSSGGPALVLVDASAPVDGIDVAAATSESRAPLTHASNSHLDPSAVNIDKPSVWNGRQTANISQQLSCEVYRELDQCRAKIRPHQRRYGLLNQDTRTLYHCRCTNRLFQILANQRQLSDVDAFLLDRVSQSCFLVEDCGAGKICKTIVNGPPLPQPETSIPDGDVDEWRHLLAMRLQVRRPSGYRVKRKHGAVRLRRLCERITRANVH